jgi:hypothetical protein
MHHAGRPVNIEAQVHQPVDHVLNLRLRRALLHDYQHCVIPVAQAFSPARCFDA